MERECGKEGGMDRKREGESVRRREGKREKEMEMTD